MPQIISTIGSSHKIEQVISEAKEYIVFVTPYLKITPPLLSRIAQADKRNIKITILYGKNDISKEQKDKLTKLTNFNLYYLENLHAKCYFNEEFGVISSMNLYEYSQINNWELGIAFDSDDILLQDKLLGEIELMLDSAVIKKEQFKRFELLKKSYLERLSEFLNNHFITDKFKYSREDEEFFNDYFEEINVDSFTKNQLNIKIYSDSTRIDFVLNSSQNFTENLKLNLNIFNDEYRVYQNKPDTISMYTSIFHRDKWDTYSDKIKFKYIAKGIERITSYLNKMMEDSISV